MFSSQRSLAQQLKPLEKKTTADANINTRHGRERERNESVLGTVSIGHRVSSTFSPSCCCSISKRSKVETAPTMPLLVRPSNEKKKISDATHRLLNTQGHVLRVKTKREKIIDILSCVEMSLFTCIAEVEHHRYVRFTLESSVCEADRTLTVYARTPGKERKPCVTMPSTGGRRWESIDSFYCC